MEVAANTYLVVGLGRSGVAAARFLKQRGAHVRVTDSAPEADVRPAVEKMRRWGIPIELGSHQIESFQQVDAIVLSPGVPHTLAPIQQAVAKGVEIMGEMELAARFISEPIVAVTGTNGKTTTTTLLGEMLDRSGCSVFVGGNIGTPLLEYLNQDSRATVVVVEVSSFQLDTIHTFCPQVAVLLNISPDHQDRYPNFQAYVDAKLRIFENQTEKQQAVFNGADPLVTQFCRHILSRQTPFFSPGTHPQRNGPGAWFDGNQLALSTGCADGEIPQPIRLDLTRQMGNGRHFLENVSAAALAAISSGGTPDGIVTAIENFKGLPHRLERVAVVDGVVYVNDSKATNTDAVAAALSAYTHSVILIMGGRDKGSDFTSLASMVRGSVKKVIAIGEAAQLIQGALAATTEVLNAASMGDAVSMAHRFAKAGDTVLLSPGCASFDMYENYAQRGDDFCHAVKELG